MDQVLIMALARALERLIAVAAGAFAIYWGYRLFSLFPPTQSDSSGRFELPGMKIVFARVGPGLLFAALGIVVLAVSLGHPVSITGKDSPDGTRLVELSGSIGGGSDSAAVTVNLTELSCIDKVVRATAKYPGDPDSARKALRFAREAVVIANWQKEWGDVSAFRRWVKDPATPGVPPEVQTLFFARASDACSP